MRDWGPPSNLKELQAFLGTVGTTGSMSQTSLRWQSP